MTPPRFPLQAVDRLRRYCESQSTRHFKARGIALKRCKHCMLGLATCICHWRQSVTSRMEFILLMHRDEVYKPTNTGRLIADLFPQQVQAFLWDRTRPEPELLTLLQSTERQCVLVFPEDGVRPVITVAQASKTTAESKILTVVLLDGTWKQARKMSKASWLQSLPTINLSQALAQLDTGHYAVRQASDSGRLATAEAAALCLQAAGEAHNAQRLLDYFSIFNEHYVATRMNRPPAELAAHIKLAPPDTVADEQALQEALY